jgi:hypothetical protein
MLNELIIKSNKNSNVTLININGSKVKTYSIVEGQNNIDVSELKNGLYFLMVDEKSLGKVLKI